MARRLSLGTKHERIVTVIRIVFVTIGTIIMLIGISGMLGHGVIDTPILNQLGLFVMSIVGIAMILTGLFKTAFFIDFVVQLF